MRPSGRFASCASEYWRDVNVPGSADDLNQSLEKAGRVADFFELAELMCIDALNREESCGGHFREEYQTPDGEAQRNDDEFAYVAAWDYKARKAQSCSKEPLTFRIRASQPAELQVMRLILHVWRQKKRESAGTNGALRSDDVNPDMSMLELLDVLNEGLILKGEEPIAFEHDCREGICGSCGFMINGVAHGPLPATTVCQLSMRHFKDGQELVHRAVARAGVSGDQGFGGGSRRVRPNHRGGRIRERAHRQRARRQHDSGSQGKCRSRDGCGGLHWMRSLRGSVSQCVGGAVHRREDRASGAVAAGPAGTGSTSAEDGAPV